MTVLFIKRIPSFLKAFGRTAVLPTMDVVMLSVLKNENGRIHMDSSATAVTSPSLLVEFVIPPTSQ